jgi:hypothetical protein
MQMNAKQRSVADFFAINVNSINELLNDPSSVSQLDLNKWDAVVDKLMQLAEADYANCVTDNQRIAVIAILTTALGLRARLRGDSSKPLSDLNDFLINGALGRPTTVHQPNKVRGAAKSINNAQREVFYVVLYSQFPDKRNLLNAAARQRFGLSANQLKNRRDDLAGRRVEDAVFDRMFSHAEKEISEVKSKNLLDYF